MRLNFVKQRISYWIKKNIKNRRSMPAPHIVNQLTIRNFAKKFEIKIFIETGTYYGEMVEAMQPYFEQIYSIELSEELYKKAKQKFSNEKNIKIIQGDSGVELKNLLNKISEPTLFWLDAHYSGGVTARGNEDTPIYKELGYIFNANLSKDVIIIDDAREFGTDPAYPSIKDISNFVKSNRPNAKIEIKDDSIIITPS